DSGSGDDEDETQLPGGASAVRRDVENGAGLDEVGPVDAEPSYVVGSDDDAEGRRDEQQHDRNGVWRAGGRQAALTPEHQAVADRGDADQHLERGGGQRSDVKAHHVEGKRGRRYR